MDRRLRNRILLYLAVAAVLAYAGIRWSGRKPVPKISALAFVRSTLSPRTPAPPPLPGRAKFDFAACDPFLPILRGPALRKAQGHIPQAQRLSYLSVACLTPVR